MLDYLKFAVTIITSIVGTVISCYKYFKSELDKKADKFLINELAEEIEKKVDKILYNKEIEFLKNQINENNKNINSKLEEMKEDMKIIKEFLINKKRED